MLSNVGLIRQALNILDLTMPVVGIVKAYANSTIAHRRADTAPKPHTPNPENRITVRKSAGTRRI